VIYMLNLASLHTPLQSSRVSKSQWHCRLGHASPQIIQKLISCFHLPCLDDFNNNVYNACQQAKSHQLPYSLSNNSIFRPLELVYLDVWGPARSTVHGEKYYVSFVDAYNRFTWVYLLRQKSDVFATFHHFQHKLERTLDKKIKIVQTRECLRKQVVSSLI
jgi:hypothetical protein